MKITKVELTRTAVTVLLTLLATSIVFVITLYVHLKLYAAIHPGEITEVDHNVNLEKMVAVHFYVGYPLLVAVFSYVFWRLTGRWFFKSGYPQ